MSLPIRPNGPDWEFFLLLKFPGILSIILIMNENERKMVEMFIEVCEERGRLISMEEFVEDIENSIGWREIRELD
jgi:hypothetical protein